MERYEQINNFWLGNVESTIIPTEHRAKVWFGDDAATNEEIRKEFYPDFCKVVDGAYDSWLQHPRGRLAQIITLDQFSRHIYRGLPSAYTQDKLAADICMNGIDAEIEHDLSLIERVFYYFPLMHSERITDQEKSLLAYKTLSEIAFAETRVIYDSFFKFANHHYQIIQRFGRFPQRNTLLGRHTTDEESQFLKELEE
ncbi:MAG: DUF924 domain-containing protein [Gammaproteobacteria bacterium]|nr:DUF924 domain-containing protein [Gammaproteobacteria bacterium]MCH9743903.1 DUF924 domain-containing protein [Gammaproteobacteria bacterium]